MDQIESIRCHPLFQQEYQRLWAAEQDRVFCRHDMEHLISVARLMYLYCLEEGTEIPKDLLYATALLHDIGRYEELTRGTPHEIAGARLAGEILDDCHFPAREIQRVQAAILSHRQAGIRDPLALYLYRGDKRSRLCFACPAAAACYWPDEKKNLQIID